MRILTRCICGLLLLLSIGTVNAVESRPRWIWPQQSDEAAWHPLSKTFTTNGPTRRARIQLAPMYAQWQLHLNDQLIAEGDAFDPVQEWELERPWPTGQQRVALWVRGVGGPAAVGFQLDWYEDDGQQHTIGSDANWQIQGGGSVVDLGEVETGLFVTASQRVTIDALDDYEQWKQAIGAAEGTTPTSFSVATGFQIELVHSAAEHEGSWVSLAFDPFGRALIAKEDRGLLRVTLSPDRNQVAKIELVEDTLEECRGLAFIGNDLYANANNSKGLFRLRSDGDRFAPPEQILSTTGGVGHGRNDLAIGPDGWIYSIHGDSVDLLSTRSMTDYTSPNREASQGQSTREGHLLRLNPRTNRVELLAAGLRNPFGIDFNADGEPFTYDADAEYDMGSPWYRPTRVSHLVTGGDYGWRGVTQSWPSYYPDHPDNARPNLDIGKGSPTAVKFGTRSHFPAAYRHAFYVLDWAYGRILAVHMVPRGSSYLMNAETLLKGRPLNVTDLDFGPDGAMYFVTGGRQTQSALYRVAFVGSRAEPELKESTNYATAREAFARDARKRRHTWEAALISAQSTNQLDSVWNDLNDPDPWIRYAARNLLERYPLATWSARSLSESKRTIAVQSLMALARAANSDWRDEALLRLNELIPRCDTYDDTLTALYACQLLIRQNPPLAAPLRSATIASLQTKFPSQAVSRAYEQNRLLTELLVDLQSPDVTAKTIQLLRDASNQTEQMHYLYVLRNVQQGWSIEDRRSYFESLAQTETYTGGQGMNDFLQRIRVEATATLTAAERTALESLLAGPSHSEAPAPIAPRDFIRQWTVEDLASVANASNGDYDRGAAVFQSATCHGCHRFGTLGHSLGPDLSGAGRRFGRRDLLASILRPSDVIAENYRSLQIVTHDGQTYVGQVVLGGDYRSPRLRLATNPASPRDAIEIPKRDIESQQGSPVSWMPTGLLDSFTIEEITDLITYLEQGPNRSDSRTHAP